MGKVSRWFRLFAGWAILITFVYFSCRVLLYDAQRPPTSAHQTGGISAGAFGWTDGGFLSAWGYALAISVSWLALYAWLMGRWSGALQLDEFQLTWISSMFQSSDTTTLANPGAMTATNGWTWSKILRASFELLDAHFPITFLVHCGFSFIMIKLAAGFIVTLTKEAVSWFVRS